ncbi:MAG: hypothetical protein FWC61_02850 [Proteobacteria bacterium]|nr:hypothetical protein [Pseudomonadota bacterium]
MKKVFALCSLLFVLCGLAACGFSPMYMSDSSPRDDTRQIFVAPISGTNGIDLRNSLRAKFGTENDAAAKFTLNVRLENPYTVFKAIQITGDATWQEVRMIASYELKETKTGKIVLTGSDTASESYTFVRDLVASQASYNNAVQSTIRVLSEKINTRVAATLAKKP